MTVAYGIALRECFSLKESGKNRVTKDRTEELYRRRVERILDALFARFSSIKDSQVAFRFSFTQTGKQIENVKMELITSPGHYPPDDEGRINGHLSPLPSGTKAIFLIYDPARTVDWGRNNPAEITSYLELSNGNPLEILANPVNFHRIMESIPN